MLKVRLENLYDILDRALTTIDRNPQILESLLKTVDTAVDDIGQTAEMALGPQGAVSRTVDQVGQTAQQAVGPGLSPEDRERAFDRFWRGAAASDGHGGGFGLGLAIVRQLLATDAGSIELRLAPGTGLDVVLRLRAVTADSIS